MSLQIYNELYIYMSYCNYTYSLFLSKVHFLFFEIDVKCLSISCHTKTDHINSQLTRKKAGTIMDMLDLNIMHSEKSENKMLKDWEHIWFSVSCYHSSGCTLCKQRADIMGIRSNRHGPRGRQTDVASGTLIIIFYVPILLPNLWQNCQDVFVMVYDYYSQWVVYFSALIVAKYVWIIMVNIL